MCQNLALYIRDCESLCLSDETLKAVGPFYLVSMPGEVKYPTHGVLCNLLWTSGNDFSTGWSRPTFSSWGVWGRCKAPSGQQSFEN